MWSKLFCDGFCKNEELAAGEEIKFFYLNATAGSVILQSDPTSCIRPIARCRQNITGAQERLWILNTKIESEETDTEIILMKAL